jgi:adenine-specific DNA methylase
MRRKLIEVSLPLEDINRESAREKSIRRVQAARNGARPQERRE